MNPERWAEIAAAFAAEREEECETGSARRRISHPRLNRDQTPDEKSPDPPPQKDLKDHHKIQSTETPPGLDEEDDPNVINVLKRILKEKVEEINAQKERISSLTREIALLKVGKEAGTSNVPTKTSESIGESRYFLDENEKDPTIVNPEEAISQPKNRRNICGDEKSKPLSETIVEKLDNMEKRMDAVVGFIQSHFPKSSYSKIPFDKLKGEAHVAPSIPMMKVWNKPPTLQPRPSYGSILREAYTRTGSNNSKGRVHTREGYNSTGSTSGTSGPNLYGDDYSDTHQDPVVEQRLQLLESLVAQLKVKFMKVLIVQRKQMRKGGK